MDLPTAIGRRGLGIQFERVRIGISPIHFGLANFLKSPTTPSDAPQAVYPIRAVSTTGSSPLATRHSLSQIQLIEGIDQQIKLILGAGDTIGLPFLQLVVDPDRFATGQQELFVSLAGGGLNRVFVA